MTCAGTCGDGRPCRRVAKTFCHSHRAECSICLEECPKTTEGKLKCGHFFHPACIAEWLEASDACPNCRCQVRENALDALIANLNAVSFDDELDAVAEVLFNLLSPSIRLLRIVPLGLPVPVANQD